MHHEMTCNKSWKQKLDIVYNQSLQLESPSPHIICECGKRIKPIGIYKCILCEEGFCRSCGAKHFKVDIDDYRKQFRPKFVESGSIKEGIKQ